MAIDYVIDYDCVPKRELTTDEILERIKGAERAQAIIQLFRDGGDSRPPSEMSFEFTRSTPQGEETREFSVQDLLDKYEALRPYEHHCAECPVNIRKRPFGCIGFIQYPISSVAEKWLLDRLPTPDDALVLLLLSQGVQDFQYDGATVKPLRAMDGTYFEDSTPDSRRLGDFWLDSDQLFEMIFAVGHINPNHAALLLLFLHAVRRDIEAGDIMEITREGQQAHLKYPFLLSEDGVTERTTRELIEFLRALYTGWKLQLRVIIDA